MEVDRISHSENSGILLYRETILQHREMHILYAASDIPYIRRSRELLLDSQLSLASQITIRIFMIAYENKSNATYNRIGKNTVIHCNRNTQEGTAFMNSQPLWKLTRFI